MRSMGNARSIRRFALLVSTVCIPLTSLILSCGKDSNPTAPSDITFPDSNVSYGRHVQPLFLTTCATAGCHDDVTKQSALSLSTYENATVRPGIIVAGNPDGSVLVQRIEGRILPRMPFNRPPLTDNQIRGIRTWIKEGAKNN